MPESKKLVNLESEALTPESRSLLRQIFEIVGTPFIQLIHGQTRFVNVPESGVVRAVVMNEDGTWSASNH